MQYNNNQHLISITHVILGSSQIIMGCNLSKTFEKRGSIRKLTYFIANIELFLNGRSLF